MVRDRSDVMPGRPPGEAVAPRGRPRSPAADGAIRDATLELLTEVGYARLTMSGVAARAGVSTATLYRRWRSKLDLVIAVLPGRAQEVPVPDTGSLRGDCRAVLRDALEGRRETRAAPPCLRVWSARQTRPGTGRRGPTKPDRSPPGHLGSHAGPGRAPG